MADVKFSELTPGGTITGDEVMAAEQGGASRGFSFATLLTYFSSGGGAAEPTQSQITLTGTQVDFTVPANARRIELRCGAGIEFNGPGALNIQLVNTNVAQTIDRFFSTLVSALSVTESNGASNAFSASVTNEDRFGFALNIGVPRSATLKTVFDGYLIQNRLADEMRFFAGEQVTAAVTETIRFETTATDFTGTITATVYY